MGYSAVRCPNCGANIDIDDSRDFGFCTYCGTKVEREKQIVELKGKISIDGVSNSDTLLERAQILLRGSDFKEAKDYFNRVLDTNPHCAEAYWGKLLSEYGLPNNNAIIERGIDVTGSPDYQRAVDFAEGKLKEQYVFYKEYFEEKERKRIEEYKKAEQESFERRKKSRLKMEEEKKENAYFSLLIYALIAEFILFFINVCSDNSSAFKVIFVFEIIGVLSLLIVAAVLRIKQNLKVKKAKRICMIVGIVILSILFLFSGVIAISDKSDTQAPTTTTTIQEVTTNEAQP